MYNFAIQNLMSFDDSFGNKGNLPLVAYMDFETTAPMENFLTPEQNKMFVISYALIFAFQSKLNLNCIIVLTIHYSSFGHLLLKSATVDYLTKDQLKFVDKDLIN